MGLEKINDSVFYLPGPVNLGLVTNARGGALLIDAGIDESVARKVRALLEERDLRLEAILITHAHADHCGGAPFLVRATGARVHATALEKAVLESPILEPLYLFSGASPPRPLRSKFFLAPGVRVDEVLEPGWHRLGTRRVQEGGGALSGYDIEVVALPGHSLGQVGVSASGVLFCADAVVGPEVVDKHGIPLNADLEKTFASLDLLEARPETFFVPAHGRPVADVRPVVAANRKRLTDALDFILGLLDRPRTAEDILAAACEAFGVTISNMGQYYLMNLTVLAYLGHLYDTGKLAAAYEGNRQFLCRNS